MDETVVLITGTSKGLGLYLSKHYLQKGFRVVGCSRSGSTLAHPRYTHHALSVADEAAVIRMVRATSKTYGRIDVLINNAGIASMNVLVLTPLAKLKEIYETNVFGTFLFSREVAKVMTRQRSGRIVNITTIAVPLKLQGELAYASSKNSIATMTEIMAEELASFNITCNAIGPGPIKTGLIKGVPEETIATLIQRQAIKRFCKYSDVSNVIDFLIAPASDYITGQIIYLGGIS